MQLRTPTITQWLDGQRQGRLPFEAEVPRAVLEQAHRHVRLSMPLDEALASPAMRICLCNVAHGLARRRR